MDEAGLIAAARLGDQDAFAELYREHHRFVRAIGRSILRTDDLDDMCQETFLSAFTRLDRFEGQAQFRTWLTRIAINRCLATLRNERHPPIDDTSATALDQGRVQHELCCVDEQLERLPERLEMERLLSVLSPAQRQVLEMAYLEDIPNLEIAEALGITLQAVKSRIVAAKRKLKIIGKP
ncbi:MAG TPA: sigma-70 family RNA polymerase sigma factor [Acidobacteriaceae bacterium]|nr:sigma-70 family RNA polymerase sigma factor [Acidobacteriaceae bacterium]